MTVTLRDVAARAGVSTAAVSRTFTPGASVSPRMRARVLKAAEALGYQPSTIASAMSTGRTKLIGLVVTNFRNPLMLDVFERFTAQLQDRGLRPLLVNLRDDADPAEAIAMLRGYRVDGVVIASSTVTRGFARAFAASGIPTVHSFGPVTPSPDVHVVGIDNVEAGRIAARELLKRGYKPGFLGGPGTASSTQDRVAGFSQYAPRAYKHNAEAYTFQAGYDAMSRICRRATGWFCADDVLSLGAMAALRDRGLRVPDQAGVIGFNDMEMASWPGIDLTTIRMPTGAIISGAIDLVTAVMDEPDRPPETRMFPCTLMERGTLRSSAPKSRARA
ncbi:LacI family DNA-binding transcriptional regulator [Jannaschia sp. LMIT008]|uniref:LacI family DNA-binding transcriptional regulator n=1 Tax=Jannaschia maritima TaxID=3032585 RepID=UPI002811BA2D|nr:LacI family DNA-binding transcriptional regulator [Jannaschia sp. LMIT008]